MNIAEFKDRHCGEPCAVLLTGESLLEHDLDAFPGVKIGVNGIFRTTTDFEYYASQDMIDIEAHERGEWKMRPGTVFFTPGPRPDDNTELPEIAQRLPNLRAPEMWEPTVLIPIRPRVFGPRGPFRSISFRLATEGIVDHNSGLFALQLAVWMGSPEIWLLGLDCNGSGHFYDGVVPLTPHRNVAAQFELASVMLRNYSIFNANPGSAVKGFPFGSFSARFKRAS